VLALAVDRKSKARPCGLKAAELLLSSMGSGCLPHCVPLVGAMLDAAEGGKAVNSAASGALSALVGAVAARDVAQVVTFITARLEAKWKVKVAALQLLGKLAAKEELHAGISNCLPQICEPLIEAAKDSHPKASVAAAACLEACTATINNQETQKLRSKLLKGVLEGGSSAADCIAHVMELTFVNAIGAPSLALFVPLILRGLRDRNTSDVVKNAAMTACNILGLVRDRQDLLPFFDVLNSTLNGTADHSSPDVREKSALALQVLKKELGGSNGDVVESMKAAQQAVQDAALAAINGSAYGNSIPAAVGTYAAKIVAGLDPVTTRKLSTTELQNHIAAELGPMLVGYADGGEEDADAGLLKAVSTGVAAACADFIGVEDAVDGSSTADKEYALKLEGMILAFGGRVLLKMTDLLIEKGKCYGFVGQNGVGKTTLLTRIAAKDIDGIPAELKCYYVAHEILSESTETVTEFMKSQVPQGCTEATIIDALSQVGFTTKMRDSPAAELSGGWRMKLAIARSMMWTPELLLLDEPTNHLDHAALDWLREYVLALRGKVTVCLVSHDYGFLTDVLTDVVHMNKQQLHYHSGGFQKFQQDNPEIVAALPSQEKTITAALTTGGTPEPELESEPEIVSKVFPAEISVAFAKAGPIGIVFEVNSNPLTVNKTKDGSQAASHAVQPGWVVKTVNGEVNDDKPSFTDAMKLMKNKERPLTVLFFDPRAEEKTATARAEAEAQAQAKKDAAAASATTGIGKQRGGNANAAIPTTGLKLKKRSGKNNLPPGRIEGAKEGTLPIIFPDPGKLQGIRSKVAPVMKLEDIRFTYPGAEKPQLDGANMKISMGTRLALLGKNGAGKTTLMKVLVGELMPDPGEGTHWIHHNLRLAYIAQHSMHHLESCIEASPAAYIQRRFAAGQDKELLNMERMALTEEDEALRAKRNAIAEIHDRVMRGKTMYYGVTRTGQYNPDNKLEWIPETNLAHQDDYVQKLRRNCDEVSQPFSSWQRSILTEIYLCHACSCQEILRTETAGQVIKARNSGMSLRPTTLAEVRAHLEDFGISGDLAAGKIKRMSGGQKSRLVLAAAMWSRPHFIALDEPTNYLDNDTLAALTHALKVSLFTSVATGAMGWTGCFRSFSARLVRAGVETLCCSPFVVVVWQTFRGGVITISHNAAFVNALCNEYWTVADGKVSVSDSAKPVITGRSAPPTHDSCPHYRAHPSVPPQLVVFRLVMGPC
jgi:ATPase subunit of ABC transporter with duplicated ATPase domains